MILSLSLLFKIYDKIEESSVFARDLYFLFNEIIRIVIQILLNDETLQR